MSTIKTVEIPTTRLPDGRYFISDEDMQDKPWVAEFVARFPDYWKRDDRLLLQGVVSPYPEED